MMTRRMTTLATMAMIVTGDDLGNDGDGTTGDDVNHDGDGAAYDAIDYNCNGAMNNKVDDKRQW